MEEFNKDWGNDAAREKVITAGREAKPAIPEEARRSLARGAAAFKAAKNENDFADAVIEFTNARAKAPWWDAPHFNLALAFERLAASANASDKERYLKEEMKNLRWYLLAAPNAPDAEAMRNKLYELEYLAERQGKQNRDAEARRAWVQSMVTQLRAFYGEGSVLDVQVCEGPTSAHVPFPGGVGYLPRCNAADAAGKNWFTRPGFHDKVSFAASSEDPSKLELRIGGFMALVAQPKGPNPDTDLPSWACVAEKASQEFCKGPLRVELGTSGATPIVYIDARCDGDTCARWHFRFRK